MLEVLRSGQLSLGPRCPRSSRRSPPGSAPRHASAVSSGTAGLHLALRAVGVTDGDEVVTSPFSFVASANVIALRAREAGVRRHRPGHAQPRPGGGRRGDHRPHDRAAAGPHLRLPRRHARRSRRSRAADRRGRLRGARRGPRRRRAVGGARQPGGVRLLRQQAAHHRRGRHGHGRLRRRDKERSTPSATRAARPTWAGSTTTGSASTTGCRDLACALGLAQLERLDEMLADRARVAALYREALARRSRASSCRARTPAATAAAGSSSSSSCPRGVDRDATIARAARARHADASPTCPRST